MKNILIVEDSVIQAKLLATLLQLHLGVNTEIVYSYSEVKNLVESNDKEFIGAIVDIVLPDAKNGEVVDYLIENRISPIVYTGKYDEDFRERLIGKDIVDYVVKKNTFNLNYVIRLVKRLINNPLINILVVDDNEQSRKNISHFLKVHKYNVIEAEDGDVAYEILKNKEDISLVIADYLMPHMDGLELVTRIRLDFTKYKLAIIGVSAHALGKIPARFLKNGANDFLRKPFSKEEFYCRVTQNIEYLEMYERLEK